MASNKSPESSVCSRSSHQGSPDEDQLRQRTEQWLTCASESLGAPPQTLKKAKRYIA